jgi:hypothetical protein
MPQPSNTNAFKHLLRPERRSSLATLPIGIMRLARYDENIMATLA